MASLTRRQLRECSAIGSDQMTAPEALSRLKWGDSSSVGGSAFATIQLATDDVSKGTCRGYVRLGRCKYGDACKYVHAIDLLKPGDLTTHRSVVANAGVHVGGSEVEEGGGGGRRSVALTSLVRDVPLTQLMSLLSSKDLDPSMVVRLQVGRSEREGGKAGAGQRVLWTVYVPPETKLWESPADLSSVALPPSAPSTPRVPLYTGTAPALDSLPSPAMLTIARYLPDSALCRLACGSRALVQAVDDVGIWGERLAGLWSWGWACRTGRVAGLGQPHAQGQGQGQGGGAGGSATPPVPAMPSLASPAVVQALSTSPSGPSDARWMRLAYLSCARITDWAAKVRIMQEWHMLRGLGVLTEGGGLVQVQALSRSAPDGGGGSLGASSAPFPRSPPPAGSLGLGLGLGPGGGGPSTPPTRSRTPGERPSSLSKSMAAMSVHDKTALTALASALSTSSPGGGLPSGLGLGLGLGLHPKDGGDTDSDDERERSSKSGKGRKRRDRDRDRDGVGSDAATSTSANSTPGGGGGGGLSFAKEPLPSAGRPSSAGGGLRAALASGASPGKALSRSRSAPAASPFLLATRATMAALRPQARGRVLLHAQDSVAQAKSSAMDDVIETLACDALRAIVSPPPPRIDPRVAGEELVERLVHGWAEGEEIAATVPAAVPVPQVAGGARGRPVVKPRHLEPYFPPSSSRVLSSAAVEWVDSGGSSGQGGGGIGEVGPHPHTVVATAQIMKAAAALETTRASEGRAGGMHVPGTAPGPGPTLEDLSHPPMRGLGVTCAYGTVRGGWPATAASTGLTQAIAGLCVDRGRLAALDRGGTLRVYATDGSRLSAGKASALQGGAEACTLAFSDLSIVTGHSDGSVVVSALGPTQAIRTAAAMRYEPELTTSTREEGGRAGGGGAGRGGGVSAWTTVALVDDGSSVVVGRRILSGAARVGVGGSPGHVVQYSLDTGEIVRGFTPGRATLPEDALHLQAPTVATSLQGRDGGVGLPGSGSHLCLVGYSRGTLLLWDVRQARPAVAISAQAVTHAGPSFLPLLNLPSWEGSIRLLHVHGSLVLDSRGAPPTPGDTIPAQAGQAGVSFPWLWAWDLRTPSRAYHTLDLGYQPSTGPGSTLAQDDAAGMFSPGVMGHNPFAPPPSGTDPGRGEGLLRVISGIHQDGERVLVSHTHVHQGMPRLQVRGRAGGRGAGQGAAAPAFHWNAGARQAAQARVGRRVPTLHPRDTLYHRLTTCLSPSCALDWRLVPDYAWPRGHGPKEVLPARAQVEREEEEQRKKEERKAQERARAAEEGRRWADSSSEEEEEEEEGGEDSSDSSSVEGGGVQARYHLPARASHAQTDPSAPASLTGLSTWHTHTLSHVGYVPLHSATALAADGHTLTAVGGEQTLTCWHTAA